MISQLFRSFEADTKGICFQGMDDDEQVLYVLRRHFITNFTWIALTFLFLFVPVLVSTTLLPGLQNSSQIQSSKFIFSASLFWYLFVFGFVIERFLHWFFNIFIITTKKIVDMDFFNLLNRNISETPLRNIEDVTYEITGLPGIVFNYGTVTIQTAAEKREFEFEHLSNPAKIADIVSDLVKGVKGK